MGKLILQERFDAWHEVEPNTGCWLWTGPTFLSGYGRLTHEGVTYRAHRLSWMLHVGDIPEGRLVCHTCDTPLCVNPRHLWVGTPNDNMQDKIAKGRARYPGPPPKTHCKRGHEFTPENTYWNPSINGRVCRACSRMHWVAYRRRKALAVL